MDAVALAVQWSIRDLPSIGLWVVLAVSIGLLGFGGDRVVTGAARLAEALGVSKVIIGATIVSLGTTSAELFVSVVAAFKGEGGLALGNAVGSIICDTALIFGLCCCLRRLPREKYLLHRQGIVDLACGLMLMLTLLLLALGHGGFRGVVIPRWVGVIYVGLLVGYMVASIHWARRHPESLEGAVEVAAHEPEAAPPLPRKASVILKSLLLTLVGLAVVIAGSELLVGSVVELSIRLGVPKDLLAVTVVAFGTSVPELATAIASLVKGHPGLMVGNIIGADILNVLSVTGLAAVAMPLNVPVSFFYFHVPVMMVSIVLLGLYIFLTRGPTFRRWQGVPLLLLYAAYVVVLLLTRGRI